MDNFLYGDTRLMSYTISLSTAFYRKLKFQHLPEIQMDVIGDTRTVYFNRDNVVNREAIRQFAHFKACILDRMQGVIHDEE